MMTLCWPLASCDYAQCCWCVDLSYLIFSDVFTKGAWSQMQEFDDPELQELAGSLPAIVLRGKAPAT